MDGPIFTRATRHLYQQVPCPSCGKRRELGWVDVGNQGDMDRWTPNEKCRNPECPEYRDPNSL